MPFRILALLVLLVSTVGARADLPRTEAELERLVAQRMTETHAIATLRAIADRHGVRVWLLGGSAATFVFRVLDAERDGEAVGEFSSIWRPLQDFDVVIDGTAEQAAAIEAELEVAAPYRRADGDRVWEVRCLREPRHDKEAILESPGVQTDFPRQHTDSLSQGLLEVTTPPANESRFRDALAFDRARAEFLSDLLHRRIRFLWSDKHRETLRYRQGLNPELFAATRYYTKKLQFGLDSHPDDRSALVPLIVGFDRERDLAHPKAQRWLARNGTKMVLNALDLEEAWKVLDDVGLREALRRADPEGQPGGLRWWLERKPLPSFPVGEGQGARADELGINRITHTADGMVAYWSLTRSADDFPNAFVSREGVEGETVVPGYEGVYFSLGDRGGRDHGFDIPYALEPHARLGSDFSMPGPLVVVLKNRRAARRRVRAFATDAKSYLRALAKAEPGTGNDRVLVEAFGGSALEEWMRLSPTERRQTLAATLLGPTPERAAVRPVGWHLDAIGHWPDVLTNVDFLETFFHRAARAGDRAAFESVARRWRERPHDAADQAAVVDRLLPSDRPSTFDPHSGEAYLARFLDHPRFRERLLPRLERALASTPSDDWAATLSTGLVVTPFPERGPWVLEHLGGPFADSHPEEALRVFFRIAHELPPEALDERAQALLPRVRAKRADIVAEAILRSPFWYSRPEAAVAVLGALFDKLDAARLPLVRAEALFALAPIADAPAWTACDAFLRFAEERIVRVLSNGAENRATQQLFRPLALAGGDRWNTAMIAAESAVVQAIPPADRTLALATAPLADPDDRVRQAFAGHPLGMRIARHAFDDLAEANGDTKLLTILAEALVRWGTPSDRAQVTIWNSKTHIPAIDEVLEGKPWRRRSKRPSSCAENLTTSPSP